MKLTLAWLKEHLETDATLAIVSKTLTDIGLEVEGIDDPGAALADFIVGHVLTADKHPQADKLKLCTVDTGNGTLQVVCGAPNARAGLKVVLARPGCVIPIDGQVLKKGTIRGVESQGMMCSSRELGLGDDHNGIIELPVDSPVGAPVTTVLANDPVIDINVTPNRADCLGVRGVARDLAAAGLGTLKPDPRLTPVAGTFPSPITVRREFPEGEGHAAPMFVGRLIKGVKNGESPAWLKDRLTAVGLRPISALVDITNYATIGWSRPLHVFDANTLTGDVVVRFAKAGESLLALNDKTYALDEGVVVIADDAGVQSIGAIMGGVATSCTTDTTDVFIEAALFDPRRIAATARRLTIESDAKHRFERGVDTASATWGVELATNLILELCGGTPSDLVIAGAEPAARPAIAYNTGRVKRIVGIDIPASRQAEMLRALGCGVVEDGTQLQVTAPSWRGDLEHDHDLVEEVARLYGYDNIEAVPLPRPSMPKATLTAKQRMVRAVARGLAARGLNETVTWSFLPQAQAELFGGGSEALRLANPISADLDAMRPSVVPNLASATGRNAARGFPNTGLFEIGPQFNGGEPGEQSLMAGIVRAGRSGPRHWAADVRPVDALDAKADALAVIRAAGGPADTVTVVAEAPAYYHPGRSGSLKLGPKVLATFGELHPVVIKALDLKGAVVAAEVFLDALPLPKPRPTRARPLLKASPFQPLDRDFAFVVASDVAADALIRAARGADKALIVDASVFDVYEGSHLPEGQKSVAVSITLQPVERTLTDAEIEAVSAKVVAAVTKATGGALRG